MVPRSASSDWAILPTIACNSSSRSISRWSNSPTASSTDGLVEASAGDRLISEVIRSGPLLHFRSVSRMAGRFHASRRFFSRRSVEGEHQPLAGGDGEREAAARLRLDAGHLPVVARRVVVEEHELPHAGGGGQ